MQMSELQAKSNNNLALCPFCGGEADVIDYDDECWVAHQCANGTSVETNSYETEAEAIAAWNSRAPIEYDGWFYLPKPKEGIVDYGKPEITRTESGYKVRQIADVVGEAARRWGDELGDYAMKRICEAWNSRAERTCKFISSKGSDYPPVCSACGYELGIYDCEWFEDGTYGYDGNYCPNCGARVVE